MTSGKECDLCGIGCGKHPLRERVGDADRFFCCPGCLNVYVILWESGAIQSGQDLRQTGLFQRSLQLGLISNPNKDDEQRGSASEESDRGETLILHVAGMWCSSCAWLVEHALTRLPGVLKVEVSFATDLGKVRYRPEAISRERLVERIAALGYKASDAAADGENDAEGRDLLIRTGLAGFLWVNIMSFSLVLYAGYFEQISGSIRRGLPFVLMALATPVVFYCGAPILRLAFRGLLNGHIRMEVLLALGILAAYGYSVAQAFRGDIHLYFDTATIIVTLVLAGKLIDRGAKEKASRWITTLHRMMPNKVRLLTHGSERFVSIDALEPDQVFMVKAGERIPADGVVIEGESHADESLLTGEAAPIEKCPGRDVAAGSINLDSVLCVRATRSASESTLARIIALVEQALSTRCDVERTVDRVSRIFVPSVVSLAVLTFVVNWLLGTASPVQCLMRSITVLVIACPCALGLATPLAITAAFGSASGRGILIRDSRVLETLGKIDTVVLDKTGTLTEGTFSVVEFVLCPIASAQSVLAAAGDCPTTPPVSETVEPEESLSLLASLEQYSEHPLGSALMRFAREQGIATRDAQSVQVRKGRGITGMVDGKRVFAGNRQLVKELGTAIHADSERAARTLESQGKTVCFIGCDEHVRAMAVFGDKLKPEAQELVTRLKVRGIDVRLVSGDSAETTKSTAARLGIDSYESEVLPEEKVERIRCLQEHGSVVAMVGDGINDAPALARADLSIAMGSGTDIAMKAASVVLMSHSLHRILEVFDLSQKTMRVVRQNLFWAFFYNIVGISLAVTGVLNPIFAACAMLLSSTSVVANSMRLARTESALQS